MKCITLCLIALLSVACSGEAENNATANNTTANNTTANNTIANNTTANNTTANNTTGDPQVVILNADDCYAFSDDVDIPLAIDGAFAADSPVWRRPHDESEACPASALLPETAALVPYVAFKFCNPDTVEHFYDFELVGQEGPNMEPALADPYLVLYEGETLPADHKQCLAANDNIEGALDSGDSEILSVTVPAGGAVTVVATTFTFDPTDGTGIGDYILIVSNAD